MSFEQQIKNWVAIDNQMKILTDRIKELRDKKHVITEQIHSHIEENSQLTNHSFKTNDGIIKFTKTKETQQLTFKYLENCLNEIIKNEEQVKKILDYIKNKREVKYSHEIKRLYNN